MTINDLIQRLKEEKNQAREVEFIVIDKESNLVCLNMSSSIWNFSALGKVFKKTKRSAKTAKENQS